MFLRMASGLGFCQVGDYVASLFFLYKRRGHRYTCRWMTYTSSLQAVYVETEVTIIFPDQSHVDDVCNTGY